MPSIRIFTQPFALLTPIDILINVLLILVIAMIAIFGLRKLLAREKNEEFRKIKTYVLMFRDGFRILKKYIWLFLIPLSINLVDCLYSRLMYIRWFKIYRERLPQEIDWRGFFSGLLHFLSLGIRRAIPSSLEYFQFRTQGPFVILLLVLAVLLGWRHIKRYLDKSEAPEVRESVSFMKKILPLSSAVAFGILISIILRISCPLFPKNLIFWTPFLSWFGVILLTLLMAGILGTIERIIKKKEVTKNNVISDIVRHFRPLFMLHLFLAVVTWIFILPNILRLRIFTQSEAIKSFTQHLSRAYIDFIMPLLYLLVLFIPYIIVSKGVNFKPALKENFLLWKKHFVKIVVFILCGAAILLIPLVISNSIRRLVATPIGIRLLGPLFTTLLLTFVNLILIAATMIFYSSVTSGKVFSLKAEESKN